MTLIIPGTQILDVILSGVRIQTERCLDGKVHLGVISEFFRDIVIPGLLLVVRPMNVLILIVREIVLLDVTLVIHSRATARVTVVLHVLHLSISALHAAPFNRARASPKYFLNLFLGTSHHREVLVIHTIGGDEENDGFLSDPVVIKSRV